MTPKERIEAALAKPLPDNRELVHDGVFDPWEDIIEGISGSYAEESDDLMIEALEAVRDHVGLDFIRRRGFAAEFALYVLSGHGMVEYGTSPRSGWPRHELADLWQPLIDKWKAYRTIMWVAP